MEKEGIILLAEDDDGHFSLIKKNLERAGIRNEVIRFTDGQQVLDFLLGSGQKNARQLDRKYLLLLDIRMPKINGVEVLEQIKQDDELKKIPVIILTTSEDLHEIKKCHDLGVSVYIVKPTDYDDFGDAIQKIGLFLSVVKIPSV